VNYRLRVHSLQRTGFLGGSLLKDAGGFKHVHASGVGAKRREAYAYACRMAVCLQFTSDPCQRPWRNVVVVE
jgi:hypothetical protein